MLWSAQWRAPGKLALVIEIPLHRAGLIWTEIIDVHPLSNDLLPAPMPLSQLWLPPEPPMLAPGIVHSQFSVQGDARLSLLAWQERMSPVYDIRPAPTHGEETFDASLSRYSIDDLSFFDIRTSPNVAERSLGRVSTESIRDITFSVFLEGTPRTSRAASQGSTRRGGRPCQASSRWTWTSRAPSVAFIAACCCSLCRAPWWKWPSPMPPRCMAAWLRPPRP
ncbi:hypothetical protein [Cupriavidus sp. D39]|uniref:hypothetical protein n=1 Tax=Cupriavidus sp. D39 TaxID=2997877 RepID=UPI00227145F2|nr:hypothetical protein [Cupriavidus sp. D39]MCY0854501.1 hypothetical protein [Cupriavidus sp. D39]